MDEPELQKILSRWDKIPGAAGLRGKKDVEDLIREIRVLRFLMNMR